jgi:hypothetical protein
MASDSRLRSRGGIDQCQKVLPLSRGDGCLSFCGDTQITYPLFMQVGSTLDSFVRTRTRAKDIGDITDQITEMMNGIVASWDLPAAEKAEELADTKVLLGGWSWRNQRFTVGVFEFLDGRFKFKRRYLRLGHPWYENNRSLVFIGDYEAEYRSALVKILKRRFVPCREYSDRVNRIFLPAVASVAASPQMVDR